MDRGCVDLQFPEPTAMPRRGARAASARPPSAHPSVTIVSAVTAAAAPLPDPERTPFGHASPAQVRAALTAEDAAEFDRQWRDAMARATDELDLTEVMHILASWRRVAWVTTSVGAERYRAALASAEHRLQTGERHPGAVSWSQLKAGLGLPE